LRTIRPHRFVRRAILKPIGRYNLKRLIGRDGFDVLLCHFGQNATLVEQLRAAGLITGRLVTIFHGLDVSMVPRQKGHDCYDRVFQKADLLLPISALWKERLIALGAPDRKTVVHHMGIDLSRFCYSPRFYGTAEDLNLLTVARLTEKKGIEYCLHALRILLNLGLTQIAYRVIGAGPLEQQLRRLARHIGVEHKVQFLGTQAQAGVFKEMQRAHIFLLTSATAENGDMEGIPVALMEAMAVGLPVVSTQHSGIPELVPTENWRFLVPERDPQAIAQAVLWLANNPTEWTAITRLNRIRVETEFSQEKQLNALEAMLEKLCAEGTVDDASLG